MEFGADIDIMDANEATPQLMMPTESPQVIDVMQKWIRKQDGGANLSYEKKCGGCFVQDVPLFKCSQCHTVFYCDKACQRELHVSPTCTFDT
jgi:hypothetical protein